MFLPVLLQCPYTVCHLTWAAVCSPALGMPTDPALRQCIVPKGKSLGPPAISPLLSQQVSVAQGHEVPRSLTGTESITHKKKTLRKYVTKVRLLIITN